MDEGIRRVLETEMMVDLWPTTGRILNKKKAATYRAARDGSIPGAVKIGSEWRVPVAKLREMVGLPPRTTAEDTAKAA